MKPSPSLADKQWQLDFARQDKTAGRPRILPHQGAGGILPGYRRLFLHTLLLLLFFAAFTPAESKQMEENWYGVVSRNSSDYLRYAAYAAAAGALLIAVFALWNRTLRRMVKERTAALEESERNYREILNSTHEAIVVHDPQTGTVMDVNDTGLAMFGYGREELPRLTADDASSGEPPYTVREALRWLRRAVEQGPQVFEWRCKRKNGERFWTEVTLHSSRIGGAPRVLAVVRDITRRKAQVDEIERLSRLYAGLSQINQAIVRTESREELFARICRVLVEFGRFKMTWVGWVNPETHEVRAVAQCGDQSGYLKDLRVFADDRPEGRGLTGLCVREGRAFICNDFFEDPRTEPWRHAAARAGIRASAAFPIRLRGAVRGALNIYAEEPGFFGEKETALLAAAAADVSFALNHLENEAERRRVEEALRESEERFRKIFDEGALGMATTDADFHFTRANGAFCRMMGYTEQELASLTFKALTHPDHLAQDVAWIEKLFRGEIPRYRTEKRYVRKDRQVVWGSVVVSTLRDRSGRLLYFLVLIEDISERRRVQEEVEKSRTQLRALLAQLQRLREDERTRIAREVHDVLGQMLTGLKMDMAWYERRILRIADEPLRRLLQEKLAGTSGLADAMIESVQKISRELRPSVLDNIGLGAALQFEARQFQERTGIVCEVSVPSETFSLEPEHAIGMFRAFQEMMTNVARHAQATRVAVALTQSGDSVTLEVRDNGRGIRQEELVDPDSLGLLGMKERAALMGGRVEIRGTAGMGTTVTLTIPVKPD
jgi:PAS domain S-box-containing protein